MKTHRFLNCTVCGVELQNNVDTYGDVGQETCRDCWYNLQDKMEELYGAKYYGLAPHHHDLTITGSFIGSTVYDPLPEPAPDGRYWIADRQMWFTPDGEVDGYMGMWSER